MYFLNFNELFIKVENILIKENRKIILGFKTAGLFSSGDVLSIVFFSKNCPYSFKGICMGIRKKSLISPNTSFFMYSFIGGIILKLIVSYYYNRVYKMIFLDYKRNLNLIINRSKFYNLVNRKKL